MDTSKPDREAKNEVQYVERDTVINSDDVEVNERSFDKRVLFKLDVRESFTPSLRLCTDLGSTTDPDHPAHGHALRRSVVSLSSLGKGWIKA